MNERIKEIGRTAGFAFIGDGVYGDRWYSSKCGMNEAEFEKFAELIVRECAEVIFKTPVDYTEIDAMHRVRDRVKNHFGVEE